LCKDRIALLFVPFPAAATTAEAEMNAAISWVICAVEDIDGVAEGRAANPTCALFDDDEGRSTLIASAAARVASSSSESSGC
jgi:hypothetical protein